MSNSLASRSEQAAELRPLLQTAVQAREAVAIEPRPEFKARARYELLSASAPSKPNRLFSFFREWHPRWATAVALLLVLLLAGGSTAVAADSSMPDSPLYPVKLATEQVRQVFTRSDLGKAELYAKLADRRVAEIVYMVDRGKPEQIEPTANRFNRLLVMMAEVPLFADAGSEAMLAPAPSQAPTAPSPAPSASGHGERSWKDVHPSNNGRARLRLLLGQYAANHPAALRAVLDKAPESAQNILLQAIMASESSYQQALAALD